MPKIINEEVKAHQLRHGDVIMDAGAEILSGTRAASKRPTVDTITLGRTRVTIETDQGRIIVDEDNVITVEREVPTDEETQAARDASAHDLLIRVHLGLVLKQLALTDEFARVVDSPWGDRPLQVAVEAIEIRTQLKYVEHALWLTGDLAGDDGEFIPEDERETATAAVAKAKAFAKHDLFSGSTGMRATSRSTSVTSNLAADVEREVVFEIARDRFGGPFAHIY